MLSLEGESDAQGNGALAVGVVFAFPGQFYHWGISSPELRVTKTRGNTGRHTPLWSITPQVDANQLAPTTSAMLLSSRC
jgi:hypothetical protein